MRKFYLTTAIAYTSAVPHIGNVYEAILADAICRYKRFKGYDVYFQTGTDEHGQKIQEKAMAAGVTPQAYVDGIANEIRAIYDRVNISYDYFIRTTNRRHEEVVQKIFRKLYEKGDIYKGHYEGNYCKACESFFTETQLVEGKCPDCGGPVSIEQEEAYFFKLAKYQQRLLDHINQHPDFIQPESRKNEMVNNFLKEPLPDLCVSRTSFDWGVKVDFDPKHVVYVWIDALSNYITELGYDPDGNHSRLFKEYWPADVHLIGKDILRFHTIYWPIMLMALDIPLPKQIFGHPWILFNKEKMSKSKGNLLYTDDLVRHYGVDATRYFVLHEIPFAQDGNLTNELMIERTNADLANTLGNLVNRTIAMQRKYLPNGVTHKGILTNFDRELVDKCYETRSRVDRYMDTFRVSDAIEEIMNLLRRANKYIDENEPWKLAKDEYKQEELENVLYNLLETIRYAATLLQSFIPTTANEIFNQLGVNLRSYDSLSRFAKVDKYTCNEQKVLFARIDVEAKIAELIAEKEAAMQDTVAAPEAKPEKVYAPVKETITYDDFQKLDLVVGQIIECKKHPNADKLLISQVNIGSEVRQVISGIAKYYKPEELVGKKVIVVRNLKEANLRGEKSYGMILCASDKENDLLEIIEINNLAPGDIVS